MRLLIGILGVTLCVIDAYGKFTYERGNCEISIFNVLQDMLKNEVRALVDPELRYSLGKRLHYDLYTPYNPDERQVLIAGDTTSLRMSNFNASWPVRFSIHGWTGKSASCSNAAIKDAYLSQGNYNVIVVDWSAHSLDISYGRISKQLPAIAATFIKFVKFLHREAGVPYENIYLIGHSAGAHISGLAGKILKPDRFGAIFALDPAGLTQLGLGPKHRLAPTDALYVESIHSDVALLGNPNTDLSQATFFANWGQGQPQCPNATATEFDFVCDHFAALYYFAESVRNPKMFGALQCENARSIEKFNCGCKNGADRCSADVFMGGEPAVPKQGIYYFSTSKRATSYGLGEVVHIRPPLKPNFLKSSFLTQRVIDKIYLGS